MTILPLPHKVKVEEIKSKNMDQRNVEEKSRKDVKSEMVKMFFILEINESCH